MATQTLAPPTSQLMTADEFLKFVQRSENDDRLWELDRGRVVELPRPTVRHGLVCANAAYLLGNYVRQNRRGLVISNDAGLLVERGPDTVYGPDLFMYVDTVPIDDLPRGEDRPPMLVVEVLSDSDRPSKMNRRIGRLLAMGVELVWVLDADDHTLTVHQARRPLIVLDSGDDVTGFEFIPDLRLKVADFFATPQGTV